MKIILKEDVKKIGIKGEVVEVADGYAANRLIPIGVAVEATRENLSKMQVANKVSSLQSKEKEDKLKTIIDSVPSSIEISLNANDDDVLFASLTSDLVKAEIGKQTDLDLSMTTVLIKGDIKKIGNHEIEISANEDIKKTVQLIVIKT